jgi:aryl-alcohol dehydrogenase-like predicted oxidoreductase
VRAGKIQYVGVSSCIGWQLQKAALLTWHLGLAPIVTLQRGIEFELTQRRWTATTSTTPPAPTGSPSS